MIKIAVIFHSESGNTRKMAELVVEGCHSVDGVTARMMPIDEVDNAFVKEAHALILGSPTYMGQTSWQMKRFLDTVEAPLGGKLGACFASQNWPGGGGADLTELAMIAAMLVHGMLIYSGGAACGLPYLHFGAVSHKAPQGLYAERCIKLGKNVAEKCRELFATN